MAFKTVAEYLAKQPRPAQTALKKVRTIIRKAVPGAEEVISYQIPAYKLPGGAVIYFAGWKEHFSLYPATGLVAEVLADELEPYKVSKGTVRFPLSEPVPVKLIERFAKLRAKEVRGLVKQASTSLGVNGTGPIRSARAKSRAPVANS